MWYSIYSKDKAGSLQARMDARPAHVARLKQLLSEGRLLLAGPRPAIDAEDPGPAGFLGSLVVAGFESLQEAQAWADADPYVESGVYESVEVTPFKRVMPL
ncbi:MAG: YciI family protein [Xanthomonadales bacterium]|nr:YciI family protein [Xanthomonadales bacterium]